MDNKFVLAFLAIFSNVIGQVFLKGGLGYKVNGVQTIPKWAKMLGAKPLEISFQGGGGLSQVVAFITNFPALIGALMGLVFFAFWVALVSKAGLGFANGMMALFFVIICIVSRLLFGEYFGGLKLAGVILIMFGFLFVAIGEQYGLPIQK